MKDFKNLKKLFLISTITFGLSACSEVEFTELPQTISLCETEPCVAPIPPDPELIEKSGQVTVDQESHGGKVDILVVVDNSISMYDEQQKMGDRFGDFIEELGDVDWQLAFTTTDARSGYNHPRFGGRLLDLVGTRGKILNKKTPNMLQIFKNTIDRSSDQYDCGFGFDLPCASNTEEPLKAIIQAVQLKDSTNQGFFRTNAALAVIVLSDENEESIGGRTATKPITVIETIKNSFGDSKKFSVYGIIIQPEDGRCLAANQPDGVFGTHVHSLAGLTGGITRSLCDADYRPSMKAISRDVKKILKVHEIVLDHRPVKNSVLVRFIPESNNVKWKVAGNKVVFEKAPADQTKIVVDFRYKAKKETTK